MPAANWTTLFYCIIMGSNQWALNENWMGHGNWVVGIESQLSYSILKKVRSIVWLLVSIFIGKIKYISVSVFVVKLCNRDASYVLHWQKACILPINWLMWGLAALAVDRKDSILAARESEAQTFMGSRLLVLPENQEFIFFKRRIRIISRALEPWYSHGSWPSECVTVIRSKVYIMDLYVQFNIESLDNALTKSIFTQIEKWNFS
jgi:hypothetical protein